MLNYLLEDKLTIKIFGNQDLKKRKDAKKAATGSGAKSVQKTNSTIGGNSTMNSSNSSIRSGNSAGGAVKMQPKPVAQNPNIAGMG